MTLYNIITLVRKQLKHVCCFIVQRSTGLVCENGKSTIVCQKPGSTIVVDAVMYGRTLDGNVACSHPSTSDTACEADPTTSLGISLLFIVFLIIS